MEQTFHEVKEALLNKIERLPQEKDGVRKKLNLVEELLKQRNELIARHLFSVLLTQVTHFLITETCDPFIALCSSFVTYPLGRLISYIANIKLFDIKDWIIFSQTMDAFITHPLWEVLLRMNDEGTEVAELNRTLDQTISKLQHQIENYSSIKALLTATFYLSLNFDITANWSPFFKITGPTLAGTGGLVAGALLDDFFNSGKVFS